MLKNFTLIALSCFVITFISSCTKDNADRANPGGTSLYSFDGAPGTCATPAIAGIYAVGRPLNLFNTLSFTVNVTVKGTYSITTTPGNGVTFSGSGTLTTTGPQTIVLYGQGTPLKAGNFLYVPVTNNTCNFTVSFTSGPPVPVLPDAGFTYTSARVFPVPVTFTNTSAGPFPIVLSIWDFGDGTISVATNPIHAYTASGVYLVRLIQAYSNGDRDTVLSQIQLNITGPSGVSTKVGHAASASFTFSIPIIYLATFSNTSTNATSYLWDFGDAASSTSASTTVTHQYNGAGPFVIKLKATGSGGTDTCSARIVF